MGRFFFTYSKILILTFFLASCEKSEGMAVLAIAAGPIVAPVAVPYLKAKQRSSQNKKKLQTYGVRPKHFQIPQAFKASSFVLPVRSTKELPGFHYRHLHLIWLSDHELVSEIYPRPLSRIELSKQAPQNSKPGPIEYEYKVINTDTQKTSLVRILSNNFQDTRILPKKGNFGVYEQNYDPKSGVFYRRNIGEVDWNSLELNFEWFDGVKTPSTELNLSGQVHSHERMVGKYYSYLDAAVVVSNDNVTIPGCFQSWYISRSGQVLQKCVPDWQVSAAPEGNPTFLKEATRLGWVIERIYGEDAGLYLLAKKQRHKLISFGDEDRIWTTSTSPDGCKVAMKLYLNWDRDDVVLIVIDVCRARGIG